MEENKKPAIGLTDLQRFPLISDLSFLKKLKQDEFAPVFNFQSGDRLDTLHLEQVKNYAARIRGEKKFWDKNHEPEWLKSYINWCIENVPFYKNRSRTFADQPTISRKDIATAPWNFVAAEANLNDLLVYQTSGTTGPAMDVIFDPVTQACWIPQLQSILDIYGISLDGSPDKVAIALICAQQSTITYASLSTYLKGAGILKINLNPFDWRVPKHRNRYLEKYKPQILTGDPFSFMSLLELAPRIKPKAMVSSAMKLTESLKKQLENCFACPVIDIYSLTECRMVAFAENNRYRAIRPELYLEIFDPEKDILLPVGKRGELVITGGTNPFLPLVRYRTGDFCKLEFENGIPYLVELEARKPTLLYTTSNRLINNIDISRAMTDFPVAGFRLHQSNDFNINISVWTDVSIEQDIRNILTQIFGTDVNISISLLPVNSNQGFKPVNYSSDWSD